MPFDDSPMIYIAAPFTSPDEFVMDRRYHQTQRYCVEMFHDGYVVFSPVVHWYYPAKWAGMRGNFAPFKNYCLSMLAKADEMLILMLPGWKDSIGVRAEIDFATEREIVTRYVKPSWVEGD